MSAKHSPGPWTVVDDVGVYSGPLIQVVPSAVTDTGLFREGLVALVYGHHDEDGNYSLEPNRRLIAAAPDLLDALIDTIKSFELDGTVSDKALAKACEAIERATGEST